MQLEVNIMQGHLDSVKKRLHLIAALHGKYNVWMQGLTSYVQRVTCKIFIRFGKNVVLKSVQ